MIIQEQILALLKTQITTLGYSVYAYLGPDEAVYPFTVTAPVSSVLDSYFTGDLEAVRVQISVFDDTPSPARVVGIMSALEQHFHRQHFTIDPEAGTLICCYKDNEFIRRDADDFIWQGMIEFIFQCQHPLNYFAASSSSSSSYIEEWSTSSNSSSSSSSSESSDSSLSDSSESSSSG